MHQRRNIPAWNFFYSLVMGHRKLLLLLLAVWSLQVQASQTDGEGVIATFRSYGALNRDYLSSVNSGIGESGKSHEQLRNEVAVASEGPFEAALSAAVPIVCKEGNLEVLRALFVVTIATVNSASESPATALGRMFMCQPKLVSSEFQALPPSQQQALFETIAFGFSNATTDFPIEGADIDKLKARLDALDPGDSNDP